MFNATGSKLIKVFSADGREIIGYSITGAILSDTQLESKEIVKKKLSDWKFNLVTGVNSNTYTSTIEAANDFDDSSWEEVKVPHDWSIALGYNTKSPGGKDEGYLDGGCGWYRTSFTTSNKEKTYLYFDGISLNADVYLNETLINTHHGWFDPFYIDVTDFVKQGENNLAILIRHSQPGVRWYGGAGLIREVEVVSLAPSADIIKDIVITSPNLEREYNDKVTTKIIFNATQATTFSAKICDDKGVEISSIVTSCKKGQNEFDLYITKPKLWDIYEGNMYSLDMSIINDGVEYILAPQSFGYRYCTWSPSSGFWLNGKNIKIKGFCIHQENNSCLGNAQSDAVDIHKLQIMKESGCNAIRTSHNATSRNFINLCNKMGFLVFEEFFDSWTKAKKNYDFSKYFTDEYQDIIERTVKRDRNAPCVFMWSVGNEIQRVSNYSVEDGVSWATKLRDEVRKYDTTRPVVIGDDTPTNGTSRAMMGVFDLIGVNYGNDNEYSGVHSAYPNKPIFGSETTSAKTVRGVYSTDPDYTLGSCLDDCCEGWGNTAGIALKRHMESLYNCGMFVWTAFDYAGESNTSGKKSSYYGGLTDTAFIKKDGFYLYQSIWSDKPMIHIVPSEWENENNAKQVIVYSNCHSIELFLNGKSLGSKTINQRNEKYAFNYGSIEYQAGSLKAIGYGEDGQQQAIDIVRTSTGQINGLHLYANRIKSDMDELIFVECTLVDENGIHVPNTKDRVTFSCEGGIILGTDNGDCSDLEKPSNNSRCAFDGKCIAIIKPNSDNCTITASCNSITISKNELDILEPYVTQEPETEIMNLTATQIDDVLTIAGGKDITIISQHGQTLKLN